MMIVFVVFAATDTLQSNYREYMVQQIGSAATKHQTRVCRMFRTREFKYEFVLHKDLIANEKQSLVLDGFVLSTPEARRNRFLHGDL